MAKVRIKTFYIIIGLILLGIFVPGYAKFMELRWKNYCLEKDIEQLEKENVRLYKERERLKQDIEYIENVARSSMGVAKQGEIPIKIEYEQKD